MRGGWGVKWICVTSQQMEGGGVVKPKKIIKELIVNMSNNRGVSKFSTMIAYLWLVDKLFVKTIKNL